MLKSPPESPRPPDIPGYEILRKVGEGGMGEVYLARQLSLDRPVAIKLLTIEGRADPVEQARRFRREAELMAKIVHAHIVSIYDYGEVDGQPFLVMEYVDGRDLRHFMEEGRPLDGERVRSLVSPLAEALDVLHASGVLHRDFKPENILIGSGFAPKVTDFGIAVERSAVGSLTEAGRWIGTLGYVAPEQQYRLKVDARADQYSMAAVMYELLTGQKPLGIFKPPSLLNPDLDPRVDDVLMRGLQEDREDRFPTIREFGAALEDALGARPRRRPRLGRLLKMVAALAAALLFLGWCLGPARPAVWVNSLGMTLVPLPPGEFAMGSPVTDPLARPSEGPIHLVKITRPFCMGAHEVTVREFRAFVEETGYRTEAEARGLGGHVYDADAKRLARGSHFLWRTPTGGAPARDDEPVTQVTWNDAVAFCRWLSRKEKRPYRLPTEAEWEYACRAGGAGRWCMGDDPARLDEFAWTHRNAASTHPVARKRPNAFGLFDMHGNVREWCHDSFGPYPEGTVADPLGPSRGEGRVLRGGSWDWDDVGQSRSAARLDSLPDFANFTYGFRVCVDLPESPPRPADPR